MTLGCAPQARGPSRLRCRCRSAAITVPCRAIAVLLSSLFCLLSPAVRRRPIHRPRRTTPAQLTVGRPKEWIAVIGFLVTLVSVPGTGHAQAEPPESAVLENVPYIGEEWQQRIGHPSDFACPSTMRSVMLYLGEDPQKDYFFYLAVSGIGLQQLWDPIDWKFLFDNQWMVDEDPMTAIRRAFEAAGYDFEIVGNRALCEAEGYPLEAFDAYVDAEGIRARVCAALDAGRPVMSFDTKTAAMVIAGYEEGGSVIVGWPHVTEKDEVFDEDRHGYARRPDWLETTAAIILVGEKHEAPPLTETFRKTLINGVNIARTYRVGEYPAGHAALDAWAESLARDEELLPGDMETLEKRRVVHHLMGLWLAEGRAYAVNFCERAADLFPEVADELRAAAFNYHIIHDLQWRLWQTTGGRGPGEVEALRFSEPEVREHLREVVALTKQQDLFAIAHIEKALLGMGVPAEEIAPARELIDLSSETVPGGRREAVEEGGVVHWLVAGVPPVGWAQGKDCSLIGALEAALAPTEYPYTYAQLMGYSGLAFRTCWSADPGDEQTLWSTDRWHPVGADGPEEVTAISRATGWKLRFEGVPEDLQDPQRHRLITDIVMSINHGLPVVMGRNSAVACVHGYHIHSMDLFGRDYHNPDEEQVRVNANDGSFHSPFVFLDGHAEGLDRREAFLEGLRIATRNAAREEEDGFCYGLDALTAWAQDVSGYDGYTQGEQKLLRAANWWSIMHLADARQAAVQLLATHSDLLGEAGQVAADNALVAYREEAALVGSFLEANRHYVTWWGGIDDGEWDAATRKAQVELLGQCGELEAGALKALADVLEAEQAEG
jgi:hypothetical protein